MSGQFELGELDGVVMRMVIAVYLDDWFYMLKDASSLAWPGLVWLGLVKESHTSSKV